MSLNKKSMVREIGRRTRLTNRDVQALIETLIDIWTEELVNGGRIELENFFVLTIKESVYEQNDRNGADKSDAVLVSRRLIVRTSEKLRHCLAALGVW